MRNRFFLPALPFGLITLGVAVTMPRVPALPGVGNAIVQLEFARNSDQVAWILGIDSTIRDAVTANVGTDQYFLIAYSLFLAFSCWSAWRWQRKNLLWIGVGLSLAAGLFDHLENQQLLAIVGQEASTWPPHLASLAWFTWLKWGAISAVLLLLGLAIRKVNFLGKVFFGLTGLGLLLYLAAMVVPSLVVPYSGVVGVLFFLLFIWEVVLSVRSKQ